MAAGSCASARRRVRYVTERTTEPTRADPAFRYAHVRLIGKPEAGSAKYIEVRWPRSAGLGVVAAGRGERSDRVRRCAGIRPLLPMHDNATVIACLGRPGTWSSTKSATPGSGSTGRTEVRVLVAFDKKRRAILLPGGDKSDDWDGWHRENISIADSRFEEHQAKIDEQPSAESAQKRAGGTTKSKTGKGKRR